MWSVQIQETTTTSFPVFSVRLALGHMFSRGQSTAMQEGIHTFRLLWILMFILVRTVTRVGLFGIDLFQGPWWQKLIKVMWYSLEQRECHEQQFSSNSICRMVTFLEFHSKQFGKNASKAPGYILCIMITLINKLCVAKIKSIRFRIKICWEASENNPPRDVLS